MYAAQSDSVGAVHLEVFDAFREQFPQSPTTDASHLGLPLDLCLEMFLKDERFCFAQRFRTHAFWSGRLADIRLWGVCPFNLYTISFKCVRSRKADRLFLILWVRWNCRFLSSVLPKSLNCRSLVLGRHACFRAIILRSGLNDTLAWNHPHRDYIMPTMAKAEFVVCKQRWCNLASTNVGLQCVSFLVLLPTPGQVMTLL